MNRYAAEGITNDAYEAGLRIAVLSDSARGARDAFDEIQHHSAGVHEQDDWDALRAALAASRHPQIIRA